MKLKKWMSIAAAVCLAVTAVPMQAAAQADFAQEMLAESREEPQEEPVEEIVEEMLAEGKEEPQEELKEEPEGKEELQEQPAEKIEPQGEEVSLLTGEENGIVVQENDDIVSFTGEGTEANPYKINSAEDLKTLAQNVNNGEAYEGKYFKQMADIDLKDLENEEWTPIGRKGAAFQGMFDGGGYQITDLTITNGGRHVGLFGYAQHAVIKNCSVTGEIKGHSNSSGNHNQYNYAGGIVGYTISGTQILNCSFRGNMTGESEKVGGIVGEISQGDKVSDCYVIGNITGKDRAGGIVGRNEKGTIRNCYYSGEVSANTSGGIAGYAYSNNPVGVAKIENCVSLAKSVSGSNANRVVGERERQTSLINNYAWNGTKVNGSVVSDNDAGGLNGADLTYTDGTLSPQFSDIFDNTDSAWKFTKDGLPILKDAGGAQSVFLPSYIRETEFQEGDGTEANPYEIRNVNDLKLLSEKVNSGETYEKTYFKQTANINLNGSAWTPIGTDGKPFKGIFDGDGHQITNLTISNGGEYIGLFGCVENAIIQNCNVTGKVEGYDSVSGIVGAAKDTKIWNCSFQGDVTGTHDYAGGIAGKTTDKSEISSCYVIGTVTSSSRVGGIAGEVAGTIKNCYALADVTAGVHAGGIAGSACDLTVKNCYYSGKVSTRHSAGGIAGGTFGSTTIKNCVSLAESVKGKDNVNRIVGYKEDSVKLEDNYGYNRTKLMIDGKTTYADSNTADKEAGKNVFVSKGKLMTDVQKNEVFDWNGFDRDIWSIPTEAGKLPFLLKGVYGEGEYPKLPTLPSKDLTINEEPQHFTTKNIGNGFVVKVTSEETLSENIKFTVKYRLSGTGEDAWTETVPRTAGTYDVQITRKADGDINPFACEISKGLVLRKKHSSSGSATAPTYTAQFDTNGGSAVSKAKTDENGKIEKPADPTKEGYLFAGWYSDSKLTKGFDFSTALTKDTTLYAKWSENNEIILTIGSQTVSVFGSEIENDVAPKIVNDRTMLPIRIVAENLGGTVTWNGELQRVTIQKGADVILITIGADTAYVNGAAVKLDAAAFVENGRTYLPLRFVSENLGAQVAWNETEKTVTITK